MKVLGVDPGTRRCGWGVVRKLGTRFIHEAHGVIVLGDGPLAGRLVMLEKELDLVVRTHAPTHASVEGLFFHKDAQAAAKLGHARGVVLLVCGRAGLPVTEIAPARAKRAIAAHGRADKAQVAQMVKVLLGLREIPQTDAADALALAMTLLQQNPTMLIRGPQSLRKRRPRIFSRPKTSKEKAP